MMEALIKESYKHKRYLAGVSENTIYFYSVCFKAWSDIHGESLPDKQNVVEWIIGLRERRTSANTCDAYARGFNSFLSWTYTEGHLPEKLIVKRPKIEKRVFKPLTNEQLTAIINYKPGSGRLQLRILLLPNCETYPLRGLVRHDRASGLK